MFYEKTCADNYVSLHCLTYDLSLADAGVFGVVGVSVVEIAASL